MIKTLGHFGMLATIAGACLVGAFSMSAQAADGGSAPPHVDTTGANMQPAWPPGAIEAKEQGTAVVGVLVNENGKPSHPTLDRSSGYSDLDDAAMTAVMNWKFVPAMRDGYPYEDKLEVGVNFQLPNPMSGSNPQNSMPSR